MDEPVQQLYEKWTKTIDYNLYDVVPKHLPKVENSSLFEVSVDIKLEKRFAILKPIRRH